MPHTRSAKKSLRQTKKRRLRNRAVKKTIKNQVKSLTKALATGKAEEIQKEFNLTVKQIDKAGAKRVIHPNKAARQKSQLAKLINAKAKTATEQAPAQ